MHIFARNVGRNQTIGLESDSDNLVIQVLLKSSARNSQAKFTPFGCGASKNNKKKPEFTKKA